MECGCKYKFPFRQRSTAVLAGTRRTETYIQYMELSENEKKAIIDYLRERPMYKIFGKNIMVHAGVFTEGIRYHSLEELMKQQQPFKMLWEQKAFYGRPLRLKDPEVRVFFGHTFSLIIRDDRGEPLDSTEVWRDEIVSVWTAVMLSEVRWLFIVWMMIQFII